MDDLISRQSAITLPVMPKEHRGYRTFNLDDAYEQGWDDLQKCIESLPSAEQRGQWKQVGDDAYRCSACGEISCCNSPFCSECGAKMEGEEE